MLQNFVLLSRTHDTSSHRHSKATVVKNFNVSGVESNKFSLDSTFSLHSNWNDENKKQY